MGFIASKGIERWQRLRGRGDRLRAFRLSAHELSAYRLSEFLKHIVSVCCLLT
jgi:hypothetical protein